VIHESRDREDHERLLDDRSGRSAGESQPTSAVIHIRVPEVDATYERAMRAGATSVNPPEDKPYGERGAFVIDPFDNQWFIATAK